MRLKLLLESKILPLSHKVWLDCSDLESISDLILHIKELFDLDVDIELYLDDFFLHPDLPFISTVRDSDLIKAKCISKPKNLIKTLRPAQKQDKNYRKQMKKSPKLVKFTGQKIKFTNKGPISSDIEYGIKAKEEEPTQIETQERRNGFEQRIILPHELKIGDKVVFTTKLNPELKVRGR